VDKVRVNGVCTLRERAVRALIRLMDKPVTHTTDVAAAPEGLPAAASAPVKGEVVAPSPSTSGPAAEAERAKAEKALRLAKALRDNLRRRKVAAKPARPSN
jgi:hypothetical protein